MNYAKSLGYYLEQIDTHSINIKCFYYYEYYLNDIDGEKIGVWMLSSQWRVICEKERAMKIFIP